MEIRKLNMLRGLAALIVAVSHFSNSVNFLNGALSKGVGQFGVMIFFILSGFLMSYLYMHKEFNKENTRRFGVARIARVIPLYIFVVLASFGLHQIGVDRILYAINDARALFSHLLLFASGVSVLWSIPVEIHFYVLFIFLWGLYSWRPSYLYPLIILLFVIIVYLNFPTLAWPLAPRLIISVNLPHYLLYFLAGVIFGQIHRAWAPPAYLRKNVFMLAILLVVSIYLRNFDLIMNDPFEMWADLGIFFVISLVFFCLFFLVPDNNIILSNPFGDFLGKISYSLYMLHFPIVLLIKVPAKQHPELFFLIFIVLCLTVASISYFVFERPVGKTIRSILRISA